MGREESREVGMAAVKKDVGNVTGVRRREKVRAGRFRMLFRSPNGRTRERERAPTKECRRSKKEEQRSRLRNWKAGQGFWDSKLQRNVARRGIRDGVVNRRLTGSESRYSVLW